MQVSTSAPRFDSSGCAYSFRFQSQKGGESPAPLPFSDLIAICGLFSEMRPRCPPLCEVHGNGNRGLRL